MLKISVGEAFGPRRLLLQLIPDVRRQGEAA